jgi:hypothetical protein
MRIHSFDRTSGDHEGVIRARNINKEKKSNEVTIVVMADTVVQPRTMVIHSQDAFLALTAMMSSRRFVSIAHSAVSRRPRESLDFVAFS